MLIIPPEIIQHIKDGGPYCHLVNMALTPLSVYLNDSVFDVTHLGNNYLGNGILQNFKPITIRSVIHVNKSTIDFAAADLSMVSILLNDVQMNRDIVISRAYLNDDGTVLGVLPFIELQVVGEPNIKTDGINAVVSLPVASIWADFEKIVGRRTTMASQQKEFPLCTGFFAASEAGKAYKWGGQT